MPSGERVPNGTSRSRYRLALAAIFVAYAAVNLITAERSPTVTMDEPTFVEPAINAVEGHGFAQGPRGSAAPLFVGLHTLLLTAWLEVVPFTLRGVRALNYLLAAIAAAVIVSAARRAGLWSRAPSGLLLLAGLLCAYSISFGYRCVRYDTLGLLVFALVFGAVSIAATPLRVAAIAAAGVVVPWAGLELIPFTAVVTVVALAMLRKRAVAPAVAFSAGIACGGASFALVLLRIGALQNMLVSVSNNSIIRVVPRDVTIYNSLALKYAKLLEAYRADPPALVLTLLVAILLLVRRGSPRVRTFAAFALALAVAVPFTYEVIYTFRVYYGWMIEAPLLVALAAFHSDAALLRTRWLAAAGLAFAVSTGLPARIGLAVAEWRSRDHGPVERMAARNIDRRDWVYTDFAAYFAVKGRTTDIALPFHLYNPFRPSFTQAQSRGIDVLVIGGETLGDVSFFPGRWREVDHYTAPAPMGLFGIRRNFGARPYDLHVYRRFDGTSPNGTAGGGARSALQE